MDFVAFIFFTLFLGCFIVSSLSSLILSVMLKHRTDINLPSSYKAKFMQRGFVKMCSDFKFTSMLMRGQFKHLEPALRYQYVALSVSFKVMVVCLAGLSVIMAIIFKNYG